MRLKIKPVMAKAAIKGASDFILLILKTCIGAKLTILSRNQGKAFVTAHIIYQ